MKVMNFRPHSLNFIKHASYIELLNKREQVFTSLKITEEQAKAVEILTRDQSKCKQWY